MLLSQLRNIMCNSTVKQVMKGGEIRLGSNSRVLQDAKISTELNTQKIP